MSAHNRVIWSEGLFLQPQHFQQQDRYFERYVETRCQAARAAQLGLHRARVRTRLPEHRQVRAAARWPACSPTARRSGCPTTIRCRRRSTSAPDVRDQILLSGGAAAPRRRARRRPRAPGADDLVRHDVRELQARNAASSGGDPALLEVGALRTRLLLASDVDPGVCLRAAGARGRVPGRQAGRARRQLHPDRAAACAATTRLATFTTELLGLLHQRGEALGGRVAATGRGAAAEFADFLMLQAINRYEPLLAHYAESRRAASRGAVPGLRRRRPASWRRSRPRRSGRRSSRPIGTITCGSRSSR